MNKIRHILSLILVLVFTSCSVAQTEVSSTNKKAVKLFNEGKGYYDSRMNELAELSLLGALEKDPNFVEAELLLAYVYTDARMYKKALTHYEKCIKINPEFFPEVYSSAGSLQLKFGIYDKALKNFEKYLAYTDAPLMMINLVKDGIRDCEFAIEAMKTPVPFNPVNMGEAINSPMSEYFPAVTVDGQVFLYTRQLESKMTYSGFNEDFYVSHFDGHNWKKSTNVKAVNSLTNEGAPTISANGRFLIFTSCDNPVEGYGQGRKGFGSCDLFYTYAVGDNWSPPRNLGQAINTRNWETQPSFSADGKTLYFIRGIGRGQNRQQDIYSCELTDEGTWTKPEPLSYNVNTKGMEESVFIHPDGKTLYFSSNGHPGMGGLDIYMTRKDEKGEWSTPVNLGYPINTFNDENSLTVGADGKIAYFASDREGGYGGLDLYQFELPDNVKPEPVNYFKGKVFDAFTKKPLEARFELIDLETGKRAVVSHSDYATGEFLVSLPINKEYALNVTSEDYLFYSENFVLEGGSIKDPYKKNVPMNKLEIGKTVVLKNVFFETDKFDLKKKSKIELDKLVQFLQKNTTVTIELDGHTDNVGNAKANLTLSNNRAKAVYDYLTDQGVAKERLSTKGFGDTKPISSNETELGRAENRRTEFKIISK
ncbi:MAG: OmpA family protein [Vicingaceae bacterium]|nr:OmpA family protein [Vicingaceae bacterium]